LPLLPGREFVEEVQEHHGIQASGDGHQDRLSAPEQAAVKYVPGNALGQTGHAFMLSHPSRRARTARLYGNRRMR